MATEETTDRPWEEIERLVETRDPELLEAFLEGLGTGETARMVANLSEEGRAKLLTALAPEEAADLCEQIPEAQAVGLLEALEPGAAAAILQEMRSDEQADVLADIAGPQREQILAEMPPEVSEEARALALYPDGTAGGVMVTEFLAFPEERTIAEVVEDLRRNVGRYGDYDVQYVYVVDETGTLRGVLRLRDLLLAPPGRKLREIMIRDPVALPVDASLDAMQDLFERKPFIGVPAVDAAGRLVGVVRRAAVARARSEQSEDDYRKAQGIVGGEELRTMPVRVRSKRRLAWLSVNIGLNVIAASVIAAYQETLASVIALAVFLPIISDMSGCSGNQAVAVSMRELVLGLIRPADALRVWLREIAVGIIVGVVLGALIALVAWGWKGNPFLGLVVGAAMTLNTLVAVSIGGTVPLLLRRFGMDPALASGPILTTITDTSGFFFVLSFATLLLPRLAST